MTPTLIFGLLVVLFMTVIYGILLIVLKNRKSRQTWSILGTIITSTLSIPFITYLFLIITLHYPKMDFDKNLWHNKPMDRYKMSDHMIDSQMLIGQSKYEVQELLGQYELYNSDRWSYFIGFPPSLGPDGFSLIIEFKSDTARLATEIRN